jgi:DNA-binding XRE family transcriptional regulator
MAVMARPSTRLALQRPLDDGDDRLGVQEQGPRQHVRATEAVPGSPEKIAELAARVRARQPLHVNGDASFADLRSGLGVRRDRQGNLKVGSGVELAPAPADTLANTFARRLRLTRTSREMSVRQLAARAGISVSTIYEIENGEHTANLRSVELLGRALGVQPLALLDRKPACRCED